MTGKNIAACLALSLVLGGAAAAQTAKPSFQYCEGLFALCTIARCSPPPQGSPIGTEVTCECTVSYGYSAGLANCTGSQSARATVSRFAPISSYQRCQGGDKGSKTPVWAWCLDKTCTIDSNNPSVARCACTTAVNKDDFIIVAEKPDRAACTACTVDTTQSPPVYNCPTATISSATVQDATAVSDFVADSIRKPREFRD